MSRPITRLVRYARRAVLVIGSLACCGCHAADFRSEYAVARVDLRNGQSIYFKREVRGINGDYDVVAISPNGDPCASVNDDTDYCICSWREYVYYKLDGDTLHLYYATANHAPIKQPFPIKVVNHEVAPIDAQDFKRKYSGMGITRLDLAVSPANK